MPSVEAKVVILGSQGVGKTSFINRYVGQIFVEHPPPTIGASLFSCTVNIDANSLRFLIWDTAGQERFRAMTPMYYRNANAAILMFDITSRGSYEEMKTWVDELKRNVEEPVICLVGNKCDMKNQRQVDLEEGFNFAKSIGALYHEASALSSEGVADVFIDIAQELLKQKSKCNQKGMVKVPDNSFSKAEVISLSSRDGDGHSLDKSFLCC